MPILYTFDNDDCNVCLIVRIRMNVMNAVYFDNDVCLIIRIRMNEYNEYCILSTIMFVL